MSKKFQHTHYFDYYLPERFIANAPAEPRDSCRLMAMDRNLQSIRDFHFYDLPSLLKPGDVLVFNNSKVIPARILFFEDNKKREIFLLEEIQKNIWRTLVKPGKFFKKNKNIHLPNNILARVQKIFPDGQRQIEFKTAGNNFQDVLEEIGKVPLPPYIKNSTATFEDYQTIYAKKKGSVAAPTAGLHFTHRLFNKLRARGVQIEFVTLHVGSGTFLPIKTKRFADHHMHEEFFEMSSKTALRLNKAFQEKRRIIAVGTTSVRVLESNFDQKKKFHSGTFKTSIFIYPGYHFKCVRGIITNFHLPQSTLLLLTSAFGGTDFVLKAYQKAVQKHYRFYSFGDAMFIY